MPRVVVAGSDLDTSVAIIDFTAPGSPTVVHVNPGFGAGCRLVLAGDRCFVGSALTGLVREIDITNPAAPQLLGSVNSGLSGIGALAVQGDLVAVGEWVNSFQARVALLDFTNRASPTLVWTQPTALTSTSTSATDGTPAISSIVFINPTLIAAAGQSDPEVVKIEFSSGSRIVSSFLPLFSALSIDGDASRLIVGDATGAQVKMFNALTNALIAGPLGTMLGGVTGLSWSAPLALAGSVNDLRAVRISFAGTPAATPLTPSAGGGFATAIEGAMGACGENTGNRVSLIDLSPATPLIVGSILSGLSKVDAVAVQTFTVTTGPAVTATPASLPFGAVRVGATQGLPFAITNSGGGTLTVSNFSLPAGFQLSSIAPLSLGSGASTGATLTVTFAPNAERSFGGDLTFATNDPARPTVHIPLSGTGVLPHISVSPTGTIDFGNTPVCQSSQRIIAISNSGGFPLTVSSLATSGPGFSVTPASLILPPAGSAQATMHFTPASVGAATGTLTITCDDANTPTVMRALTGTALPQPPPELAVAPNPLDLGTVAVNFFAGRRLVVSNTGPCQALNLTISSSGAPFFVTTGDPTSVPPTATPVTASIPALGSLSFAVVFAPTALGQANGMLTITSNAGTTPTVQVPLAALGVNIAPAAFELVLDRSGSMAAPAPGGTKMDALKSAVHLLADLLPAGQGEAIGGVDFDDAVAVLTSFADYDSAQRTAIEADVDTLTPRNFTSIGGGIRLGLSQLPGAARKVLIVFTDGLENTPPSIASEQPAVVAAGAESYAVGLGQPQNISAAALSQLASSSGGRFFQTDDTLILRKAFVEVLVDAFRQNLAADPLHTLATGQVIDVPVRITNCESNIAFVLAWDNPNSQLELEIISPGGTTFTPTTPTTNQLVNYGARPGYRFYRIAFPPLDPGSGQAIGPARVGQWNLRIRSATLGGPSERCTTSVFVEGDLTMRVAVNAPDAHSPLALTAKILHDGAPVPNANVVLSLTRPLKSLSQVQTPQVLARARDADSRPIPAGSNRLIPVETTRHKLTDAGEDGYYVTLPAPGIDGVYEIVVEAIGPACGGTFQRYSTQSIFLARKWDPAKSKIETTTLATGLVQVTITPNDTVGEALGPGALGTVTTYVSAGRLFSLERKSDGSIRLLLRLDNNAHEPHLRVQFADVEHQIALTP